MQNFGRFVDHCDKSMRKSMAERFKDDAQHFKSLLSEEVIGTHGHRTGGNGNQVHP